MLTLLKLIAEPLIKLPFVVSLLFFLSVLENNQSLAMSLEEALPNAIVNSPKIRSSRSKVSVTRESLRQVYSNYLPTVLIDLTRGRERDSAVITETGSRNAEITEPETAKISMSLNLYRGGKTSIEIKEAENKISADVASLKSDIQNIVLEAALAYSGHYKNIKSRALNQNNKLVLKALLDVATARSKFGEVSETDVYQAKARYADAVAKEIKSEGDFLISKNKFESVFGVKATELVEPFPLKIEYTDLNVLLSVATPNNLKLVQLRELQKAANNNVRKLKRDLLPTVKLDSDYTRGIEVSNPYSESRSAKFVVALSMPLYRGGNSYSKIRQATHSAQKADDDYAQALKDTKQEVIQAWFSYKTAQSQIIALKEAALSSKMALSAIKKEADVGSRAFVEVLDAEQELLESNVSLLGAKNEMLAATYKIKQVSGQLIPEGIEITK